jgi:signal recognition particle subunit SRP54
VLDATLKEITAALLESDVNVKLVASLRTKVKAKVKLALEGNADKSKDSNKKNMMQKVIQLMLRLIKLILTRFYIYRPYLMS